MAKHKKATRIGTSEVEKKGTEGCPQARELLGKEVSCLECPLSTCLLTFPKPTIRARNIRILRLFKEGKSRKELARAFKLSYSTIKVIITTTKEEITNDH